MKFQYSLLILGLLLFSCKNAENKENETKEVASVTPVEAKTTQQGYKKAYFASGCFWCVEAVYESIKGVKESISGYSGGSGKNPTYENYGDTDHAEAVEVIYDPSVVSFEILVDAYFKSQNVTQSNGQGPDLGREYRSIIFYQNAEQKAIIDKKIEALSEKYVEPIAAEVKPFEKFWPAEEYHQDYKKKHPNNPYVQNVSNPRYYKFKKYFDNSLLKEK